MASDIICKNLGKDQSKATLKRILFFVALIFVSFVLLTPTYAVSLLETIGQHSFSFMDKFLIVYISPLVTIFINFVIIPSLIDFMVHYEDYRRKSSVQNTIIRRIYFMFFLNILLLPISETSSAIILAKKFEQTDIFSWPKFLSSNLINQQYFYIKLMI